MTLVNGKNVKNHSKGEYLKGDDIEESEVIYEVYDLNEEELQGEDKLVIFFKERKRGLVLNKTNVRRLMKLFGDDGNQWLGKRVKIVTEYVDYPPGQTTRVLRVHPELLPQAPPVVNAPVDHPPVQQEAEF